MIKNLHIENYALIEHLDIDMHSGFSVITGETGAGKSIILGAIGLLLGARADSKSIKAGAGRCIVEATFDVSQYGLDSFFKDNELDFDGAECIIRRELTSAGKSRAFINDTPASLSQLKEVGEHLIDIHSQHKNLLLGKEDFQMNILDTIAQNSDRLSIYNKEYLLYRDLLAQLQQAKDDAETSRQDEEFIRYQVNQLADAALNPDEQELLEAEAEMLSHAEDIKSGLYQSLGQLRSDDDRNADTLQLVKACMHSLQSISNVYSQSEELLLRLDSCYIDLKDIADEIESSAENIEFNPERLDYVDSRLSTIYSLQKKHSVSTVQDLLDIQSKLEHKLLLIDNSDELIEELSRKCESQYDKVYALAEELSAFRKQAAEKVNSEMVSRLIPLGMPNVQFDVHFTEEKLSSKGLDRISFMFSANKNAPLCDVSQVASGGEIARVMLALKAMIAGAVQLPTIIFDEIDTGVSGSIAEKMARIMHEMGGQDRQVISITHLPQIAALGSTHYKVYKQDNEESTVSNIVQLTTHERIEEIAHMLSGENLTKAALDNAKSLLNL